MYPVLYDNWLFLTLFLFPPKKKREEEKENEVAKPFFFRIDLEFTSMYVCKYLGWDSNYVPLSQNHRYASRLKLKYWSADDLRIFQ